MKWFWFPIAVVATSIALVVALGAIVLFPVRVAVASGLGAAVLNGPWHGGPWGHGSGFVLPTQVQGLLDLPPNERFSHFEGVQISLKDKDNRPLLVSVTPGTVTAAAASLSHNGNEVGLVAAANVEIVYVARLPSAFLVCRRGRDRAVSLPPSVPGVSPSLCG